MSVSKADGNDIVCGPAWACFEMKACLIRSHDDGL